MNNFNRNYGSLDFRRESVLKKLSVSAHPTINEKICMYLIRIQESVRKLNNNCMSIGTVVDTQKTRREIRRLQKETNNDIEIATRLINKLDTIVKSSRAKKPLKVQSEKLISDFSVIQKKFSQLNKQLNTKMNHNQLEYISEEEEEEEEHEPQAGTSANLQQQEFLPIDPNFELELVLETEQNVKQIESDVIELSRLMNQIGVLVNEQGKPIEDVAENVNIAAENVEDGRVKLRDAARYQRSARKKAVIIAVIVAILLFILISIIYSKVK